MIEEGLGGVDMTMDLEIGIGLTQGREVGKEVVLIVES